MKRKSKKDLVIIDKCLNGITGLESCSCFSNSIFFNIENIGLKENASDRKILDKTIKIKESGEYNNVSIITKDKGRDGDKTLRGGYKNISIIYLGFHNISKIPSNFRIKNLESISGYNVRIYKDKIEKTKFKKYGKEQITHTKFLKNKK